MKNSVKVVSLFLFLVVVILTTVKISQNKPVSETVEEVSYAYSIKVNTVPACYTGTCKAVRVSDGVVFNMPYEVSVGGYYTWAQGLGPGTYTIYVCCGGRSGTGTVTIPNNPTGYVQVTINLTGYCESVED